MLYHVLPLRNRTLISNIISTIYEICLEKQLPTLNIRRRLKYIKILYYTIYLTLYAYLLTR